MSVRSSWGPLIFALWFAYFQGVPAPPANGIYRTSYNETEARLLVNLAAGAYADSPQGCIDTTFGPTAHLYNIFTSNNLVCDILKDSCASYTLVNDQERRIYVVFRGTKTDQQLLYEGWQSLAPKKDFYGAGMANKYFTDALEVLWPNVQGVFQDPRYQNYAVTFTGHSLGAALAALGALKTVLEGHRTGSQIHLVTFGEPRVGNVVLARKFDEVLPYSYRVVHYDDIVPHLPKCAKDDFDPRIRTNPAGSRPCDPNNLQESYHHGVEIWYPNEMGPNAPYYECLGTPRNEDFTCSDSLVFHVPDYKRYIASHRYYFGHKVPPYGKSGCTQAFPLAGQTDEYSDPSLVRVLGDVLTG